MLNLYEIKSNRQFSEVAGQQRKSVAFQTKNDSGLPSSCKALPFGKQILIIGKTMQHGNLYMENVPKFGTVIMK